MTNCFYCEATNNSKVTLTLIRSDPKNYRYICYNCYTLNTSCIKIQKDYYKYKNYIDYCCICLFRCNRELRYIDGIYFIRSLSFCKQCWIDYVWDI